jgi:hypothetical protein
VKGPERQFPRGAFAYLERRVHHKAGVEANPEIDDIADAHAGGILTSALVVHRGADQLARADHLCRGVSWR